MVQAANYLNIESLLDKACQAVANMIKGKTPEEIRQKFNIKVSICAQHAAERLVRLRRSIEANHSDIK